MAPMAATLDTAGSPVAFYANDERPQLALLHMLPSGLQGIRAEEPAYRQYNSCVDFTFQEMEKHNSREFFLFSIGLGRGLEEARRWYNFVSFSIVSS